MSDELINGATREELLRRLDVGRARVVRNARRREAQRDLESVLGEGLSEEQWRWILGRIYRTLGQCQFKWDRANGNPSRAMINRVLMLVRMEAVIWRWSGLRKRPSKSRIIDLAAMRARLKAGFLP